MRHHLLLRNIRPLGGDAVDMLCEGTRIAVIGANLAAPEGCAVEEGHGALLLPGLIEGHCHLDKALWGMPWWVNENPPHREARIANEKKLRRPLGKEPYRDARALAEAELANGTTRLRTHVDIDEECRLSHVEALLRLRADMADRLEIQLVAFPQSGIVRTPGAEGWLDEAMRMGCDVVGGIDPSVIDRDPVRHLDAVFRLAERHGKPVDIHLHEPHELGAFSLELMAERTRALGLQGRVTVSHGFCLGDVPAARGDQLLAMLAESGIAICTSAPAGSNVPPLERAAALGVTVFAGNDNIRDTWMPFGHPDMLERAMFVAMKNNLRSDRGLELAFGTVGAQAAKGAGFSDYGLAPGARADLVLVEAETLGHAVVERPVRRLVVAQGRVVARDGRLTA
ncbi:MAG: amidohydrolase family protein [Acetobacteraceae bacterium]|nr:amidohydrolase family protein [Acetobacteraceae bacterium]